MASNTLFIAPGIFVKYLEKTALKKSVLPPGLYKTSLDTSPPQKSSSLHCNQINKVKNKLDGQPSSLLTSMHIFDYKTTFSPIPLVYLELETHQSYLDFKILDENSNVIIPSTFYLQLFY